MNPLPRRTTKPSQEAMKRLAVSRDRTRTPSRIVVTAGRKADELLRFMRQVEQAFAEGDRNRRILRAVHDQERRRDALDARIGAKAILQQQADRQIGERRGGNVRDRRVGRFEDEPGERMLGGQRDRNPGAERIAPRDHAAGLVALRRKRIGGRRIREQAVLAGLSARAGIAAIGQRDQAGAVRDDVPKRPTDPARKSPLPGK